MKHVKPITYALRTLSLPFVAGIWLIFLLRLFAVNMVRYVRYGGEMIIYMAQDGQNIVSIYNELVEQRKAQQDTAERIEKLIKLNNSRVRQESEISDLPNNELELKE